ncbi:MAG: ThiF family adenylyltransferase [Candidatus Eisenbacteria bacterium]|nr:ThiF family adenylyltransferase [Candidatus Eisenbacteria bacterium]
MRSSAPKEGARPLLLPKRVRDALIREAERSDPRECCGFLVGWTGPSGRTVAAIRPERNREEGPRAARRFLIPAEAFWRERLRADRAGLAILGFYHSHPESPALPSAADGRRAWPGRSTLIIGADRSIRSWLPRPEGGFDEEPIESTDADAPPPCAARFDPSPSAFLGAIAGAAPEREEERFTGEEKTRYARHLVLPEIGPEGQARLRRSRVLVVGAGGLGSPALLYLAAAGVGRLGVADPDTVDLTNLQRQILHDTPGIDRPKTASAAERLRALNPNTEVIEHERPILPENALDILGGYDLVVDGTDNLPSRYLLADACGILGLPMAHGSVDRFGGQVSLFPSRGGPCYRCLYPEPPPPGVPAPPPMAGVFAPLPGVVGALLASEALKTLLGAGDPLAGRLLLVDLLRPRFRIIEVPRDPGCPLCGERPSIRALDRSLYRDAGCFPGEEDAACLERADRRAFAPMLARAGLPPLQNGESLPAIETMTPQILRGRLDRGDPILLLDVRRPAEARIVRIEGSRLLPIEELPERTAELDRDAEIVCICRVGIRAARAAMLLLRLGFPRIVNLEGGILAWIEETDPGLPRY